MLIDQVFLYFLIAAGVIVSLPALWLLMRARWPQRVEKLREVSGRSMILSFLAGIPVVLLEVGLIMLLAQLGKRGDLGKLAFVALGAVLTAVSSLAGLAGLATLIGERLTSANSGAPWKTTLYGGVVLVFVVSMPYVGWFALLPISIIIGGGMMVRSLFMRTPRTVLAPAPQTAASTPPAMPAQTA